MNVKQGWRRRGASLFLAGGAACLAVAAGCVSRAPVDEGRGEVQKKQLAALETLAAAEADVIAFVRSFPEVAAARVLIRPGTAVVLIEPADAGHLSQTTIEKINAYIVERAGIDTDHIVMKLTAATGEKR